MNGFVQAINLAVTIISCIVFGLVVGFYLDSLLHSKPAFMILGLLTGTVFAFMALYRMAKSK